MQKCYLQRGKNSLLSNSHFNSNLTIEISQGVLSWWKNSYNFAISDKNKSKLTNLKSQKKPYQKKKKKEEEETLQV